MSAQMTARVLKGVVGALAIAALAIPTAVAKGGPPEGHGPGSVETTANNLSVPAMFVGSYPYALTCDGEVTAPTGEPLSGYSVPGEYFVQGEHVWQAACGTAASAAAVVEWGDNLGGDAKLKVGSPIRVEVGLLADAEAMTVPSLGGYTVIKLEPNMLDRESPYGTAAPAVLEDPFDEVRVWTQGATLKIWNEDAGVLAYDGAAGAEINATGRVVYGYNLRVGLPGVWTIQYFFPGVTVTGSDIGDSEVTESGTYVTMHITAVTGGGKGGGKNH
jgi:hypothetical protein